MLNISGERANQKNDGGKIILAYEASIIVVKRRQENFIENGIDEYIDKSDAMVEEENWKEIETRQAKKESYADKVKRNSTVRKEKEKRREEEETERDKYSRDRRSDHRDNRRYEEKREIQGQGQRGTRMKMICTTREKKIE